jgi:carotenoid 1,2-hydratase
LTIIAFVGSVFSPYYAAARRKGPSDPLNHCAFNVALYGPRTKHWAMTERTRQDLRRHSKKLEIGPSSMSWDGTSLLFGIDERCAPYPARLKGAVRASMSALTARPATLDERGQHAWLPIAPSARVEMDFENPDLRWQGEGYFDCNFGSQPLECAFKQWNWSRAHTDDGTIILYDIERRDGSRLSLARLYDSSGHAKELSPPPDANLPPTLWRVPRSIGCDIQSQPRVIKALEDAPFYARSMVETTLYGNRLTVIHESLSLDRFANPLVRALLTFRMPRRRYRRSNKDQLSIDGT